MFIIIGFIIGFILGTIKFIMGDEVFNAALVIVGLFLAFKFFSKFGFLVGTLIIIFALWFIIGGLIGAAKDFGSEFFGNK